MNVHQLRYFVDVAKYLSFTQAADENYVAQSAISQQIANLEKELGFRLFERTSRSVRLTSAGMSLFIDMKSIIKRLDISVQNASHVARGESSPVRIGFQGKHEKLFLPKLVHDFGAFYTAVYPAQ